MTAKQFLAEIAAIVDKAPTYRLGGTGVDGTCDCIGLIMGAVQRREEKKYPLHSSNYFVRYEVEALTLIDESTLAPGTLVFKARQGLDLNERYRDGGAFYNGDLLDYYHAGVVTGANPVKITHCTSGDGVNGITTDTGIKGWTHAAVLPGMDFWQDAPIEETTTARVRTYDGNPLKLRPTPSKEKPYLAKIPNGEILHVHADAQGWSKVTYAGMTGYCMSEFLVYDGGSGEPQAPAGETVTITMEKALAQQLLDALLGAVGGGARG